MDFSATTHAWVRMERILPYLQPEPFVVLGIASLLGWLFYRFALRSVNEERHSRLQKDFRNLIAHFLAAFAVSATFWVCLKRPDITESFGGRALPYAGLIGIIWMGIVFIKLVRFALFEYLFFLHMKVGVPVLLVNLSTLVFSLLSFGWLLARVFEIDLAPLFATSAVVSIVLGLALQETLGNLFSGVALQFDKPYEIGDWIEVQASPLKWAGRVQEITWRATVLISMGEEIITIPNRVIAQAQVSNFSSKEGPFCRVQPFRFPYGTEIEKARKILLDAAGKTAGVKRSPGPLALVRDLHESWIELRLVYLIEDYGNQYLITDSLLSECLRALQAANLPLAAPRIEVYRPGETAGA